MNKQNEYKIEFDRKTITLTKKFAKAAGSLNSKEYKVLKQLRSDYPDYSIELREIAKSVGKKTYANLTYDAMRTHIALTMGKEAKALMQLEEVIQLAVSQPSRYAYVKKWFLENYPNYAETPTSFATNEQLALVK